MSNPSSPNLKSVKSKLGLLSPKAKPSGKMADLAKVRAASQIESLKGKAMIEGNKKDFAELIQKCVNTSKKSVASKIF